PLDVCFQHGLPPHRPPGGTPLVVSGNSEKTQKAYDVSVTGARKSAGVRLDGSWRHFQDTVPPVSDAASFSVDLSPATHPGLGPERQTPDAGSQVSQGGQATGDAPAQLPAPSQVSTVVQASWSSHVVPASAGVPPTHAPAVQLAPTRHGAPQAVPSGSI